MCKQSRLQAQWLAELPQVDFQLFLEALVQMIFLVPVVAEYSLVRVITQVPLYLQQARALRE
jgi:hypothetical protein